MVFSRSALRRAKCTTFSDIPPLRNTLCAVAWNSASTDSISFLPSMLVRSTDSSTGRRSCASSSVKVRDIACMPILLRDQVRSSLVVGRWSNSLSRAERGESTNQALYVRSESGGEELLANDQGPTTND